MIGVDPAWFSAGCCRRGADDVLRTRASVALEPTLLSRWSDSGSSATAPAALSAPLVIRRRFRPSTSWVQLGRRTAWGHRCSPVRGCGHRSRRSHGLRRFQLARRLPREPAVLGVEVVRAAAIGTDPLTLADAMFVTFSDQSSPDLVHPVTKLATQLTWRNSRIASDRQTPRKTSFDRSLLHE